MNVMILTVRRLRLVVAVLLPALVALVALQAQTAKTYFPPPGQWQKKAPTDVGMDAAKLQQAVEFAQSHGSSWDFEKDQVRTFGTPVGPLPKQRAATNGIIVRHGYIVAEFGDTKAADPVYSVAKSFLSTVASLAVERGLIKDLNDPVFKYVSDGGYDSEHNRKITWKNHLQQESEWEGTLWGKNANFIGAEQFGAGEHKPRAIHEPGSFYEYNDVRINRLSLSLLRLFGAGLPEVLKAEIMDPIGASQEWHWHPYNNSMVEIGGAPDRIGERRHALGRWAVDQLGRFGAIRPVDSESWPMARPAARFRAMAEGRGEAERAWPRLWLPVVAEHAPAAMAERAGYKFCGHWERRQHHLDRSGARHCVGVALVSGPDHGRHDSEDRRGGERRLIRPWASPSRAPLRPLIA